MKSPDSINDKVTGAIEASREFTEQQEALAKRRADISTEDANEPLPEKTNQRVGRTRNASDAKRQEEPAVNVFDKVSPIAKSLIAQLEEYSVKAGTTARNTESSLLALQHNLVRIVETGTRVPDDASFVAFMTTLLDLVRRNVNGAFSTAMMYRYFAKIERGDAALDDVRFFLDMVVVFSDPKARQVAMQRYNIRRAAAVAKGQSERLIRFITKISG